MDRTINKAGTRSELNTGLLKPSGCRAGLPSFLCSRRRYAVRRGLSTVKCSYMPYLPAEATCWSQIKRDMRRSNTSADNHKAADPNPLHTFFCTLSYVGLGTCLMAALAWNAWSSFWSTRDMAPALAATATECPRAMNDGSRDAGRLQNNQTDAPGSGSSWTRLLNPLHLPTAVLDFVIPTPALNEFSSFVRGQDPARSSHKQDQPSMTNVNTRFRKTSPTAMAMPASEAPAASSTLLSPNAKHKELQLVAVTLGPALGVLCMLGTCKLLVDALGAILAIWLRPIQPIPNTSLLQKRGGKQLGNPVMSVSTFSFPVAPSVVHDAIQYGLGLSYDSYTETTDVANAKSKEECSAAKQPSASASSSSAPTEGSPQKACPMATVAFPDTPPVVQEVVFVEGKQVCNTPQELQEEVFVKGKQVCNTSQEMQDRSVAAAVRSAVAEGHLDTFTLMQDGVVEAGRQKHSMQDVMAYLKEEQRGDGAAAVAAGQGCDQVVEDSAGAVVVPSDGTDSWSGASGRERDAKAEVDAAIINTWGEPCFSDEMTNTDYANGSTPTRKIAATKNESPAGTEVPAAPAAELEQVMNSVVVEDRQQGDTAAPAAEVEQVLDNVVEEDRQQGDTAAPAAEVEQVMDSVVVDRPAPQGEEGASSATAHADEPAAWNPAEAVGNAPMPEAVEVPTSTVAMDSAPPLGPEPRIWFTEPMPSKPAAVKADGVAKDVDTSAGAGSVHPKVTDTPASHELASEERPIDFDTPMWDNDVPSVKDAPNQVAAVSADAGDDEGPSAGGAAAAAAWAHCGVTPDAVLLPSTAAVLAAVMQTFPKRAQVEDQWAAADGVLSKNGSMGNGFAGDGMEEAIGQAGRGVGAEMSERLGGSRRGAQPVQLAEYRAVRQSAEDVHMNGSIDEQLLEVLKSAANWSAALALVRQPALAHYLRNPFALLYVLERIQAPDASAGTAERARFDEFLDEVLRHMLDIVGVDGPDWGPWMLIPYLNDAYSSLQRLSYPLPGRVLPTLVERVLQSCLRHASRENDLSKWAEVMTPVEVVTCVIYAGRCHLVLAPKEHRAWSSLFLDAVHSPLLSVKPRCAAEAIIGMYQLGICLDDCPGWIGPYRRCNLSMLYFSAMLYAADVCEASDPLAIKVLLCLPLLVLANPQEPLREQELVKYWRALRKHAPHMKVEETMAISQNMLTVRMQRN